VSEAGKHAESAARRELRVGTAKDVAAMIHVSVDHLYEMVQKGEIPTIRSIGPRLRFDLDEVAAWMREDRQP
jgi:excisionase family DNA binding protein